MSKNELKLYEMEIEKLVANNDIKGLINLSKIKNLPVSIQSIQALGNINDKSVIKYLKSVLSDFNQTNATIRHEALKSLNKMGWKPENNTEEFYYLAAIDKWKEITSKKYLNVLIDAGLNCNDRALRFRIVRILGRIDEDKAIYGLYKLANNEHTHSSYYERVISTAKELLEKSGKSNSEISKIIYENEKMNLENKIELCKTKIDEMKNYGVFFYLEKFVFKFRGYHGDFEIKKLKDLLNYKGYDISKTDLKNILDYLVSELVYNEFKKRMQVNNLNNLEEYTKVLFEAYNELYENYLGFFERLLHENNITWDQKTFEKIIHELKKEKEILLFEEFLVSDTSESPFITINDVDNLNGYEFENLLKVLLEKKGYHVENTPLSGDQGADLIINKLGERITVQAKCYNGMVSNKAVQEVVASIAYYRANRGIVITNSDFTSSAYDLADSNNIELINRKQLEKMIKYYLISKEEIS
jgi:HJR/Mrr/RecB family endonuclease